LYYSLIVKPDGKIATEGLGGDGKTYYSKGAWTLTGNIFTATYTAINNQGDQIT